MRRYKKKYNLHVPLASVLSELEGLDLLPDLDDLHVQAVGVQGVLQTGGEVAQVAQGGLTTGATQEMLNLEGKTFFQYCIIEFLCYYVGYYKKCRARQSYQMTMLAWNFLGNVCKFQASNTSGLVRFKIDLELI